LMKQAAAVDAAPVNNTTYTANSAFGAGTQVGTGNYVVFNATGNSVLVTGLTQNTTYHFSVFEFNDFGATSQFLLTSPAIGSAVTSSVLPVTFIDFTGRNVKNEIKLEWSTSQEFNSAKFEIQKASQNVSQDFVTIGIVQASGESASRRDYHFTDIDPLQSVNYFRIRQVDRDGRFMYSRTISVRYEPTGLVRRIVNPVQENLFIQLSFFENNPGNEWRLYDMGGRLIHRAAILDQVINAPLPHVRGGIYIVEVRLGSRVERIRILKGN
ncbi:MAG: T9SS type A sorting domain-containing protein, partial [Chitinophagaceae bacterium]|nr:T9SS type A sorting domain-containing protein [Chitinophagaceae bacterium]